VRHRHPYASRSLPSGRAGGSINLVATSRGDFRARLTWVKLRRLRLVGCRESASRVTFVALAQGRVCVAFPTLFEPAPVWSGMNLRSGDIVIPSRKRSASIRRRPFDRRRARRSVNRLCLRLEHGCASASSCGWSTFPEIPAAAGSEILQLE
jgi:hypothetical protein